ncbi:MAG: sulfatase/phosphatase domain-containing protein, partial [Geminicoccaceae bacterium]
TFDDDYKNRARAAAAAKMRVRSDMTYKDLGLVQPEGGIEVGEPMAVGQTHRKVPDPDNVQDLVLIDQLTGEQFRFETKSELAAFKYQRYIKRYLRTVASIDENVGRLLGWLDEEGLAETTMVIYTSDQGFFLGEHGWFDKRFMYEESLQMPFLVRYPQGIAASSRSNDMATNVDFAPTFLDYAGAPIPTYMQGHSLRPVFEGETGPAWQTGAYHRYWMHKDEFHYAWAHYGLRNQRYKLIYWYNSALGQRGAVEGDEPPEWELFDCEADPLELFNIADDRNYADIFRMMLRELDAKMAEIGDIPEHDTEAVLSSNGFGA